MRRDDFTAMVEQRRHLYDDLKGLEQRAREDNRRFTGDETKSWESTIREIERLNPRIEAGRAELAVAASAEPSYRSAGLSETTSATDHQIAEGIRSVNKGETRALSTAVSVSPGELSTVLYDRLRASSVVLSSGIKTITTDADSVVYPTLSGDVVPAWYAEAAAIAPGDPSFSTLTATPRKLSHLVQVSNEALDDSDPSIATVLSSHLLKVLALKLDAGLLEGTGTAPEIRGLRSIVGIQTVSAGTNGATPTLDVFADAIAALEGANVPRERIRIVAAPRNVGALRKLKANTGGSYLWSSDPSATSPSSIFGVPVAASAQLSTNEVQGTSGAVTNSAYVYDIDSLVYVQRSGIEIELDRSRLFNSDQSEMRGKLRDLISPTPTGVVRVAGLLA